MTGTAKKVMRIVLAALLLQFASPVFLSEATSFTNETHGYSTVLHAVHHAIATPQFLLEELDESETKAEALTIAFFTLIDFSDHSFALTELHETKFTPFVFHDRIDHHPPLFTLYSTFII